MFSTWAWAKRSQLLWVPCPSFALKGAVKGRLEHNPTHRTVEGRFISSWAGEERIRLWNVQCFKIWKLIVNLSQGIIHCNTKPGLSAWDSNGSQIPFQWPLLHYLKINNKIRSFYWFPSWFFYCYFFSPGGFLASPVFGCFLLNLFVFLWHLHLKHKPLSTAGLKPASPFRGEEDLFHQERGRVLG